MSQTTPTTQSGAQGREPYGRASAPPGPILQLSAADAQTADALTKVLMHALTRAIVYTNPTNETLLQSAITTLLQTILFIEAKDIHQHRQGPNYRTLAQHSLIAALQTLPPTPEAHP